MKKLISIILILIPLYSECQEVSEATLKANNVIFYMHPEAGSCASPDGSMNSIAGLPPSYAWLQANGYCNPNSYGNNPTVCWTFTPTSSSVTINSGYSTTGCANVSFGAFNLYDVSCTLVGTGLTFGGLTPGQQYTWCMSGSAWGGGPGCIGFTDFCPYYTNNTVLPVELVSFTGKNIGSVNKISWVTVSEINNNYFVLQASNDAFSWEDVGIIDGNGNSNTPISYSYNHKANPGTTYYRLIQVDFNGRYEEFDYISVNTDGSDKPIVRIRDIMGNIVTTYKSGLMIYEYEDGTKQKFIHR